MRFYAKVYHISSETQPPQNTLLTLSAIFFNSQIFSLFKDTFSNGDGEFRLSEYFLLEASRMYPRTYL